MTPTRSSFMLGVLGVLGACTGELADKQIPDTATTADAPPPPPIDVGASTDAPPPIEPEPLPPGTERPVTVVRTFRCEPAGVGAELVVGEIAGRPGDLLTIRPSAPDACRFTLHHRAASGADTRLSDADGSGYLFAAGVTLEDGRVVVCANDVHHSADAVAGDRHVDQVTIVCTSGDATLGRFAPLAPVVVPDGAWAAWLRGLAPAAASSAVTLAYARDFSYQFMNLSDEGRPTEDGIYEVVVPIVEAGALAPSDAPRKMDDRTNPLADAEMTGWEPSAEELEALRALDPDLDAAAP